MCAQKARRAQRLSDSMVHVRCISPRTIRMQIIVCPDELVNFDFFNTVTFEGRLQFLYFQLLSLFFILLFVRTILIKYFNSLSEFDLKKNQFEFLIV